MRCQSIVFACGQVVVVWRHKDRSFEWPIKSAPFVVVDLWAWSTKTLNFVFHILDMAYQILHMCFQILNMIYQISDMVYQVSQFGHLHTHAGAQ